MLQYISRVYISVAYKIFRYRLLYYVQYVILCFIFSLTDVVEYASNWKNGGDAARPSSIRPPRLQALGPS